MNEEQLLKLQAHHDGELPEKEQREVLSWLAKDEEAARYLAELRNTRKALAGAEGGIRLPESRDFYWSKISRAIESTEMEPAPAAARTVSWAARLRRFLVPAGAMAGLVAAGLLALNEFGPASPAAILDTDTTPTGSQAFTYQDSQEGVTLVWISDSTQNDIAAGSQNGTVRP
jgi:anti-sigma factor RsiW